MRQYFSIAMATLSLVLAFGARADESGQRRQSGHQPYVNVGNDQQDDGGYQYPQEQSDIPIQNGSYPIQSGQFLVAGVGLPQRFVCSACAVVPAPAWPGSFFVVAQSPSGMFFRLAGPVPGGVPLITLVNTIKMQTGMCQNLPFIPVGGGGCNMGCGGCGGGCGGGVGIGPGVPPIVGGPGMRPPMWGPRPTPFGGGGGYGAQMPTQMPAQGMYGGGPQMGYGGGGYR